MTKKEALQKIKELEEFVTKLELDEKKLQHGDKVKVYDVDGRLYERIIIKTSRISESYLKYRYLFLDKNGNVANWGNSAIDMDTNMKYTKLGNVFED